jgi:hypothetical protein
MEAISGKGARVGAPAWIVEETEDDTKAEDE